MSGATLSQRESDALREFSARIRAALGSNLQELRLFGSKARGDSRPDSDLDVLVVVTDDRVRAEDLAIDIAFDINVASDLYISPRVVAAASLIDPVWRTTLFVQTVTREGVAL
jgi:predicted nucleotidyltransferase